MLPRPLLPWVRGPVVSVNCEVLCRSLFKACLRQGGTTADASSATSATDASSEWRFGMAVPSGIPRGLPGVNHALVQEERLRAWLKCSPPLWLRVVRETLGEFSSSTPLRVMHDCEGINSPGEALRLLRLHGCFDHPEEIVAVSDIDPACRRWNLLHHTQPKVSFTDMLQRDFARGGATVDALTGARIVAASRNSGISLSCALSQNTSRVSALNKQYPDANIHAR